MKLTVALIFTEIYFVSSASSPQIGTINAIKLKTIKCDYNEAFFEAVNCSLTPTKNGHGLVTISATVKDNTAINDVFMHFKVFHKFYKTYRSFLVDAEVDLCCAFTNSCDGGVMMTLLLRALGHLVPQLIHECPYFGSFGIYDLDFERLVSHTVSQIIPAGDYKVLTRYYQKNNVTLANVVFLGEVQTKHLLRG